MMVTAKWNGAVIAESEDTVVVEGNHYFPREAVRDDLLRDSQTTSHCPWKGGRFLSFDRSGWRNQCRCRMVLSRSQRGGGRD